MNSSIRGVVCAFVLISSSFAQAGNGFYSIKQLHTTDLYSKWKEVLCVDTDRETTGDYNSSTRFFYGIPRTTYQSYEISETTVSDDGVTITLTDGRVFTVSSDSTKIRGEEGILDGLASSFAGNELIPLDPKALNEVNCNDYL